MELHRDFGDAQAQMGQIMQEYNVWTPSGFDMLKAQAVAHEFVARKLAQGFHILLDARLLEVQTTDEGVAVTYITNQGIHTVTANRLIDATVNCISAPDHVRCIRKTLNVFTVAMTDTLASKLHTVCPDCQVLEGSLENEKLILFPAAPDAELEDVYLQIMQLWHKAFPDGAEKILFVAETFDGVYEAVAETPAWVNKRFTDPMTAFEEGEKAQ